MTDGIQSFGSLTLDTGRLVLTTKDSGASCPGESLEALLMGIGFIGSRRSSPQEGAFSLNPGARTTAPSAGRAFDPGDRFSQHLGFTGCAVQIGGESDIHLRLPETTETPRLYVGRNSRAPRCPGCGATLKRWRAQLAAALAPDSAAGDCKEQVLCCPGCGQDAPTSDWDWRKHAGVGKQLLIIEGIFPAEASPLPALLKALETLGLGAWRYFYLQR